LTSSPSEYVTCPDCGAGRGKPHFLRCELTVPAYILPVGAHQFRGLTAYSIWVFPLDTVRREVIRAMLPRGQRVLRGHQEQRTWRNRSRNRMSDYFRESLKDFADAGWIWTTAERIHVLERGPLYRFAERALDRSGSWWLTEGVRDCVADLAAHLPATVTPGDQRQRDAELAALRRLMEQTPVTGPHQGRGWVRITPRPGSPG
jgi:hypothetical protein